MSIPVAIYARVSSEKQAKSDSIDHQISMLKDHLATRLGEDYYTDDSLIYRDDAISGYYTKISDRPDMQRMINDAKKGRFQVALFKEIARMGRDGEENVKLPRIFESHGVRVVVTHDNYDSDRPETKSNLPLSGAMAERYSEALSLSVSSSLREKARQGKWSAPVPLGYKLDRETKKLVIDEQTADLPKLIFDLYVNHNMGTKAIAMYLNEKGYRTKRGYKFDKSGVNGILSNQAYLGYVPWGMTRTIIERTYDEHNNLITKKRAAVPRKDFLMIKNAHPALIDEMIFWRVQEIMKTRAVVPAQKSGAKHPLVGLLICAKCGKSMLCQYRKTVKYQYRYYKCGTMHRMGKTGCDQGNIRADKLEKVIYDNIMLNLTSYDYHSKAAQGKDQSDSFQERIKVKKSEKQKLIQAQTQMTIDRDTLYTPESFRESMLGLKKKIEQCDEQIHIMEQQLIEIQNRQSNMTLFRELLEKFKSVEMDDLTELRSLFHAIIERIEIIDPETIGNIVYRYSFS